SASPHIYTLSLHDALPISPCLSCPAKSLYRQTRVFSLPIWALLRVAAKLDPNLGNPIAILYIQRPGVPVWNLTICPLFGLTSGRDRKSTRLNSSHVKISYA